MSYYIKDLREPCNCSLMADTTWFLEHPDRRYCLRRPWQCEEAPIAEDQVALVSQLVCAQVEQTLNQIAEASNHRRGVMELPVVRRSFLFMGKCDPGKMNTSDESVSQFLAFINDGSGEMVNVTVN